MPCSAEEHLISSGSQTVSAEFLTYLANPVYQRVEPITAVCNPTKMMFQPTEDNCSFAGLPRSLQCKVYAAQTVMWKTEEAWLK